LNQTEQPQETLPLNVLLGRGDNAGTTFGGGHRPLKFGRTKNVQNLVMHFRQLSNLSANISGTDEDIDKL